MCPRSCAISKLRYVRDNQRYGTGGRKARFGESSPAPRDLLHPISVTMSRRSMLFARIEFSQLRSPRVLREISREPRSCNLNIRHDALCKAEEGNCRCTRSRYSFAIKRMRTIASRVRARRKTRVSRVSFRYDDSVIMSASRVYVIDHSATIHGDTSAPSRGFCLGGLRLT